MEVEPKCPSCHKLSGFCVCAELTANPSTLDILILQHPQERRQPLGTACLVKGTVSNCVVKTGLSWANATKAAGKALVPSEWGVLYLGGAKEPMPAAKGNAVFVTSRQGQLLDAKAVRLKGIVILDGTWAQAKTLWWRNPWLLKLQRIRLNPSTKSLFGKIRKEPRKECLSTVEAVSLILSEGTLTPAEKNRKVVEALNKGFGALLDRANPKTPPKKEVNS
jgi:DTW domain-containing protein YfiP